MSLAALRGGVETGIHTRDREDRLGQKKNYLMSLRPSGALV
jgi:hypothetical protein